MASIGDNKVTATTTATTVINNGVDGKGLSSTDENPKKIVDLNTSEPDRTDDDDAAAFLDDGEVKGLSESGGEKKDETDSKAIGSDDDIQKKIKRAERFGVTVTLTEEEKRNSRAERFGTVAATVNGSEGAKKAEELKRKARADRFGVPATTTTTTSTTDKTEEEAKKKARLARFGNDTKANTKVDAKVVDSAEEDKRKARALRFSKPATDSSSDLTGKQDIVKEATVPGNAA